MLRRILTMLVAGKVFRMLMGRHGGHHAFSRAHSRPWSHRHHRFDDLTGLLGLHRRRRSFI